MPKCIYCLQEKESNSFKKVEHIMPQSFGKFHNNYVLNNTSHNKMVCDDCNQFFGDKLEIHLARGTYEGVLRYKSGIKEPKDFKKPTAYSSIVITLAESRFKGMILYLNFSEEKNSIVVEPIPQIAFKKENNEYDFFVLDNCPSKKESSKKYKISEKNGIVTLGYDWGEAKKIIKKYLDNDNVEKIDFQIPDTWLIEIRFEVSTQLLRCIAKIAFNYLAYFNSDKIEQLCNEKFNEIREFILNNISPHSRIKVDTKPILGDERNSKYYVDGHIVIMNIANDNSSLICQISLFNQLKYTILLCDKAGDLNLNVRNGSFFDIYNKKIHRLYKVKDIIIPYKKIVIPSIIIPKIKLIL